MEGNNGPFPHYALVIKHKEMRMRLGFTISYKSLYLVHLSLELVPFLQEYRKGLLVLNVQTICKSLCVWG